MPGNRPVTSIFCSLTASITIPLFDQLVFKLWLSSFPAVIYTHRDKLEFIIVTRAISYDIEAIRFHACCRLCASPFAADTPPVTLKH